MILENWEKSLACFVKVLPREYRKVLEHQTEIDERARKLSQRQAAVVA